MRKLGTLRDWDLIRQPHDATCISCKFDHQMAPLVLVAYLAIKWHNCIGANVGHQVAPLVLFAKLATRLCNLHCLGLPYWHYQLVLS